jgi:hypothetical protein
VKVNSGDERRFWPCRDGEVKEKGEGEETWAAAPKQQTLHYPLRRVEDNITTVIS